MKEILLFFCSPLCIILSLVIIPLLPADKRSWAGFFFVFMCAIVSSIPAVHVLFHHGTVQEYCLKEFLFEKIPIRIDPLSAWFVLIINITCINGAFYGIGYLKPYEAKKSGISLHWVLFVTFHSSMLWVCILQHGLAFLVAWEIMSISSLLLIIFEHSKQETLKAGVNYLIQMHIGAALLSIAFIWIYLAEGSYDFLAIGKFFSINSPTWVFLIFFLGFGIKAGFIPMHTWLPHAHPAAPSHISGVMSGVIVKLGIYGILRIISFLHSEYLQIGECILVLSLITALYGILNAAINRDFKRMLAFCTIENIGIIGMGIGLGLIGKAIGNSTMFFIGFAAALFHTLNHALIKSLLFFSGGNIYQQTHIRNMEKLGGLIKHMPLTAFFFLAGSIAIGGLPPFNGFVSEFLVYMGLIDGIKSANVQFNLLMILSIGALALVGGISTLTFTKSFGTIFLGKPRSELSYQPLEVSTIMLVPLFIILTLMMIIGIFPNLVFMSIAGVVRIFDPSSYTDNVWLAFSPILKTTGRAAMLLIGLISLVYYLRVSISRKKSQAFFPTWGCGYVGPNTRMQYTARSFVRSLAKLFSFFIIENKKYNEINTASVFPSTRTYQSNYREFFETKIIDRFNNRLIRIMNYFTFIHNGQTQIYVLYGLFFIIALIAATFLNII